MMRSVAEVMMWTSLALIAFSYVVYPLLIWGCSRLFGCGAAAPSLPAENIPHVTLLIAAHNEERWIRERLENALQIDYPHDRLEILVASDGSRDATVDIVNSFSGRGVRV